MRGWEEREAVSMCVRVHVQALVLVRSDSHTDTHACIMIMIVVISVAWYITEKGEHATLYMINKSVCIIPKTI